MSDTPRTDEVTSHDGNWDTKALRMAHFARQLDRKLVAMTNKMEFYKSAFLEQGNILEAMTKERDELLEALRKCVTWAEDMSAHYSGNREEINWTYLIEAREVLTSMKGTTNEASN